MRPPKRPQDLSPRLEYKEIEPSAMEFDLIFKLVLVNCEQI